MSDQSIDVGSIVELKSGSPPMTVDSFDLNSNKKVFCKWFIDNRYVQSEKFNIEALKVFTTKKGK